MKLVSKLAGGGTHPGSGIHLPSEGHVFETDERGEQLVEAKLASIAPAGAKVTWPPPPPEPVPESDGEAEPTKKRRGERREE